MIEYYEYTYDYACDLLDLEKNYYELVGDEPSIYYFIYNTKTYHVLDVLLDKNYVAAVVADLCAKSGNSIYDYKEINMTEILDGLDALKNLKGFKLPKLKF